MSAPISRNVVISPVRSGLVMTSVRITSEPGTSTAATIGKAAEDGSAGTTTGAGASSGSPCKRDLASGGALGLHPDVSAEMGRAAARYGPGSLAPRRRWFRRGPQAPPATPPT